MVVQGDFEVKLVLAGVDEDELPVKTRFPEHTSHGQVYVEVEPDAEYLVAVRRVGKSHNKTLLYTIEVDGKCLGWKYRVHAEDLRSKEDGGWTYSGQRERDEHGNPGDRALRFVTPRLVKRGATADLGATKGQALPSVLMGEVKVKIYDAIKFEKVLTPPPAANAAVKMETTPNNESSSTSPKSSKSPIIRDCTTTERALTKTKIVRSGLGSTYISHAKAPSVAKNGGEGTTTPKSVRSAISVSTIQKTYKRGHRVDEIVLKYATTPALEIAGAFDTTSSSQPLVVPSASEDTYKTSNPINNERKARVTKQQTKDEKSPKKARKACVAKQQTHDEKSPKKACIACVTKQQTKDEKSPNKARKACVAKQQTHDEKSQKKARKACVAKQQTKDEMTPKKARKTSRSSIFRLAKGCLS